MSSRDNELLLGDMLESADRIRNYVQGLSFEAFIEDQRTKDAVIRNFEIIGEAANRIDDKFKSNVPEMEYY